MATERWILVECTNAVSRTSMGRITHVDDDPNDDRDSRIGWQRNVNLCGDFANRLNTNIYLLLVGPVTDTWLEETDWVEHWRELTSDEIAAIPDTTYLDDDLMLPLVQVIM